MLPSFFRLGVRHRTDRARSCNYLLRRQGSSMKAAIMTKNELPKPPPDVDEASQRSTTSFADAHLGKLFYALLDEEDVEEMLREFMFPAGPR